MKKILSFILVLCMFSTSFAGFNVFADSTAATSLNDEGGTVLVGGVSTLSSAVKNCSNTNNTVGGTEASNKSWLVVSTEDIEDPSFDKVVRIESKGTTVVPSTNQVRFNFTTEGIESGEYIYVSFYYRVLSTFGGKTYTTKPPSFATPELGQKSGTVKPQTQTATYISAENFDTWYRVTYMYPLTTAIAAGNTYLQFSFLKPTDSLPEYVMEVADLNIINYGFEEEEEPGYIITDYDALFEQPLVLEDYSDQMDEPYAKYGMFLTGTIHENKENKYNAGTSSNGELSEAELREDIKANLPELNVERILTGNYAFVSNCTSYWNKDQKAYMDKPAVMDADGNFSIPAEVAESIFGVTYDESYVPATYIESVTDYEIFTDIRGFLMFSEDVSASVDTSLVDPGENQYYADYFYISDCIGTISWEDIHPTTEQYEEFRNMWKYSTSYPEGMEEEYADYIAEGIAVAKEHMAHVDHNNPVNSPFDNIYIPDLYEEGYDEDGNAYVSHSNQQGIEKAYGAIADMARGYYLAKRTGAESEEWLKQLRNDIIYTTIYMREKHLSNNAYPLAGTPRFTCFQITTFYQMCTAFIQMGDDLPKQVVYDTLMDFCARNRYVTSDYTNRFWIATPHILTAIILEDDTRLNHGYRYLNQCFTEVKKGEENPMNPNGFYDDGSFPYHGGLAYNLGYGQSFVISASELISVTNDTVFDISKVHSFENMYKWIKNSWLPFIYKNKKMKMVAGRETPYSTARHPVAAMLLIADNAPTEVRTELMGYIKPAIEGVESQFYTHKYFSVFRSLSYPYIIENIDGIINDTKNVDGIETAEYNKFYYNMDRVVHKRDGWMFGIAMSSARTGKYESSNTTPVSSLTEWYISDGMTYLHNDDVQYLTVWWKGDPYFLSGTTVDDAERSTKQTMSMSEEEWGRPENLWAGGATTGQIGVAAYENGNQFVTGLDALKSYFMFEDYVVCLGTGITAGSGVVGETGNAYTVVERRQLVEKASGTVAEGTPTVGYEDVVIDGETLAVEFDNKKDFENPGYVWVEKNTGYVFMGENNISLKRENVNNYSFLKVVAEHGANVNNDTYGYTILPLATAEETANWAKNPEVEIIEQSNTMHAVRQKATGVVMANIFEATTLEGIQFETPCSVIIVPEEEGKTLYVSDPTQKCDEINMVFPDEVSVLGETATANGNAVTVSVNKRYGDTYSFKVTDKPLGSTITFKDWTKNSPSSGTYMGISTVEDDTFGTVTRYEGKGVANGTNYTQYKQFINFNLPEGKSAPVAGDKVMVSFYYRINTSDTYVAPKTFTGSSSLNKNATTGRTFGDVSITDEWQYVSYISTIDATLYGTPDIRQVSRFTTSSNTDKFSVDIADAKAVYVDAVDATDDEQIEEELLKTTITSLTVGGASVSLIENPTSYTVEEDITANDVKVTTVYGTADKVVTEKTQDGTAVLVKVYAPYVDWRASDATPSVTYTVNIKKDQIKLIENNGYGTGVVLGTDTPTVVGSAGSSYSKLETITGPSAAPFDEYYSWTREAFTEEGTSNTNYLAFDGNLSGGASAGDWVYVSFYYRTYNRFTNSEGVVVDNGQIDLYPAIRSNSLDNPYYRTETAKYIRLTPDTTAESDVGEWKKLTYIQKLDNDTNENWTFKLTSNHSKNATEGTISGSNRKIDIADVKVVYFGLPVGSTADDDAVKAAIKAAAGNYGLSKVYINGEEVDTVSNPLGYTLAPTPRLTAREEVYAITGDSIHAPGLVYEYVDGFTHVIKSYPLDYDWLSGTDNRVASYTVNAVIEYDFYDFKLDGLTLSLKADNGLTTAKNGVIIGASYDANGKMLKLKSEPFSISGLNNNLSVTIPESTEEVASLKFFVWDGIVSGKPYVKTIYVDDFSKGKITQGESEE